MVCVELYRDAAFGHGKYGKKLIAKIRYVKYARNNAVCRSRVGAEENFDVAASDDLGT